MKLVNALNPDFRKLLNEIGEQKVPVRTSFKIFAIARRIEEEAATYESTRKALLTKAADKDAEGKPIIDAEGKAVVSPENLKQFSADLSELLSVDVDLGTLTPEELGEQLKLTAREASLLSELIDLNSK